MGNHMYLLDCYAGSCEKHLKTCFPVSACRLLWLWESQFSKHPVCFSLPAFFTEKPKKPKQTPPELGFAFPFYISGIAQRKERDQWPGFTPEASRRSSNEDEDSI
jgi:hypothetical protein